MVIQWIKVQFNSFPRNKQAPTKVFSLYSSLIMYINFEERKISSKSCLYVRNNLIHKSYTFQLYVSSHHGLCWLVFIDGLKLICL
jgi:hypothetical protein